MPDYSDVAKERAALLVRRLLRDEITEFSDSWFRENGRYDAKGQLIFDEFTQHQLTVLAMRTLAYLTAHGDREAAKILLDRGLGPVEQSFTVRLQGLSADQVDAEMLSLLIKCGESEAQSRRILAANAAGDPEPLMRAIQALPAAGETVEGELVPNP